MPRIHLALCALALSAAAARAQEYDLLIKGGLVVDGTGVERFAADVAIAGDRIVAVSRTGIDPSRARSVIDARGRVVTPGFVDNHAHVQESIADHPLSENFLRQGVTTLVASLHSGSQPWPLD
ncbi:MAG TPA: amidohydrolase family protein, partial [Longimicrobiales bacterium]|nr:amidohydrolase family protein [Longimicrobiales bacterium]